MSEAPEFVPLSVEELQVYFPQYEILSFIAAGGMGAVYLANQKSIDRRVAVKVLPRELSSNDDFSSQFRAEAKVMSKLNHPNLIGFFDFGEVDGMLFIVMEFVDGKSLHHSAHGEAIEQDTALGVAIGITEGVDHAHNAGILHRDIKPANVLLDQNAFPKLGDFGLARPVEESEAGKVIFGTPGYTAPEVVENPESIDERSDIYSIGAILYELLTGYLPQHQYMPPSKARNMDPAFDKVVQKAISFDPDLRYPNTGAFLKDLKKIKLFHERGHVAPTQTAPISAPKADPDIPEAKIESLPSSSGNKTAAAKPPIATASSNSGKGKNGKLMKFGITGAAAILALGLFIAFTKKEEAVPEKTQNKKPASKEAIVKDKPAPKEKPVKKPVKALSSVEKLEALAGPLSKGDLSEFPEGTTIHTDTMRAFFLYDVARDWHSAQMVAEQFGGYLGCADSSEVRAKMLNHMRGKTKSAWLGGGTAGDAGIKWINGKKWNFPDTDDSIEGYVSLAANGFLQCEDATEKKPFFICWNIQGAQEGEMDQQYFRLKRSAKSDNPILPPGAVMSNKSIYILKLERKTWLEASQYAKRLNARLAVPSDSIEHTFLSSLVLNSLDEGKRVWMGGEVERDGSVKWGKDVTPPTTEKWIREPQAFEHARGIAVANGEKVGWVAIEKKNKLAGQILEWKRQKEEPVKVVEKPVEKPLEFKIENDYVVDLLEKARAANNARKEERMESESENILDAKRALGRWMSRLTENNREEIQDGITAYFIKSENINFLHTPTESADFSEAALEELEPFLDKQKEISQEYVDGLIKLKDAMADRIITDASSESEDEETLMKAARRIKQLNGPKFQELLDGE